MPQWNHEHLHALANESEPQKAVNLAVQLAQDMDMEFLGIKVRIQLAAQSPRLYFYSNYPADWIERYHRDDYYKQDAAATASHTSTMPVLWSDDLYRDVPHYREQACAHGLRHGWTQSLHDLKHNEIQLSVCRPLGEVKIAELYENAGKVQWLCHTLHKIISEYHMARLEPQVVLSNRECQVLDWAAKGKTAEDTSRLLSLSTSTVNFHIRSVISKTNAANKAGAIAIALMHGLIEQ